VKHRNFGDVSVETIYFPLPRRACLPAEDNTNSALCRRACPFAIEIWNAFLQAGVRGWVINLISPQSHVAIKTIIITIYEYRDGLCGDDHKRATNVFHVNHRMVER
jgi:hypothetical protein